MEFNMNDMRDFLEREAALINRPEFIADDPVQFPRRFESLADIEITALLASAIAWGNRKMICRDADRMLALMDHQPYKYMMDRGYEDLDPDMNIHRTFFARNLVNFLSGLRRIYERYASLADFARANNVGDATAPAWRLVELVNAELDAVCEGGVHDSRCLPGNLDNTALKRVNMALRWLVRDDGIVDMGVWKGVIDPSRLYIPLDVHVGNTARSLGLLERRGNDRRAVEQLTEVLRQMRPADPVYYDYALFGIGVTGKSLG
ncbi:TIGR02757 family protein [uncultured Muribaculum sp.]|uniref:TIGR02757 family protein n=1 Tax=uncultured Muribaculum sp. TaxID=1918613 RepID=UPI0025DEA96D|nr:TIGR02757 family protein [uncultured Muribaculum sp.]